MAATEVPRSIERGRGYPKISFDDKASISAAIRNKQSFELTAIRNRQSVAVKWLRKEIEKQGMTSRTFTNNRWFLAAPVALIPAVGPWLAWAVAAKFIVENIVRSPDYDIRRGFFVDFIEITCQKQN